MKRTLQIVLALALASMFLVSPVAAATSQGLEWGVSVDDELLFHLRIVEGGTVEYDEGMNLTVETTPSIPDPLPLWDSIPSLGIDMVYTNGSAVGLEALILIGLVVVGGHICIPTGNYTLLAELIDDNPFWTENHTLINDGTYFGARMTATEDNETGTITAKYLKADGFLAEYSMSMTNESGITNRATFTRDGLGFDIVGFLTDNALYVGIGVVVLLVIVVIARRR